MQRDLDKLKGWAITNHMKLNKSRFCTWDRAITEMHRLEEDRFESNPTERDLVDRNLNISHQCALAARRVSHTLGCLRHSTASRSREGIVLLWLVLWPHLKDCVQH